MIIVQGVFELDADQRDRFLAERHEQMRTSREEAGCEEYCLAADPLEPRRVVLTERWTDQASLDAHLARLRGSDGPRPTTTASQQTITIYEVASERRLV